MDEKFHARSGKAEFDEDNASQQQVSRKFTPEAGPSLPSPYAPPPFAPPPFSSALPTTVPTNGLNISTLLENIKGVWLLDPLAPQSTDRSVLQVLVDRRAGRRPRRFHNMTTGAPTAKLDSRRGSIFATIQVVGESAIPATATIRSTTHDGNIVLELVSARPNLLSTHIQMRAVPVPCWTSFSYHRVLSEGIGNISLLIPRSFSGVVELRGRRGDIELLPALAAYARVERANNNETVVVIGSIAPPTPGFAGVGDIARIYSRSGRMRLGFCGEDSFTESGSIIGQIFQRFTR
ncbi:hypothetical protein EI94DRAFT_1726727 [Lactarius quietus]|nr:hypothetical protein EI94DRAFT_1726727 [Lactarius quietus]